MILQENSTTETRLCWTCIKDFLCSAACETQWGCL